jgi:hypothetical protein
MHTYVLAERMEGSGALTTLKKAKYIHTYIHACMHTYICTYRADGRLRGANHYREKQLQVLFAAFA